MNPIKESQPLARNMIIYVAILVMLCVEITLFLLKKIPFDPVPHFSVLGGVIAFVLLIAFVFRLDTTYSTTGITYRFIPFHGKERTLDIRDMKSIAIRNYKPVIEYGGWGIRGFRKNRAFNISGKIGVQVELKSGERILFGTRNPQGLEAMITEMQKLIRD